MDEETHELKRRRNEEARKMIFVSSPLRFFDPSLLGAGLEVRVQPAVRQFAVC